MKGIFENFKPKKKEVRKELVNINWKQICKKLPTMKGNPAQAAIRKKMFKDFDPNGNGYLSLAEVDKGIQDVLGL